MRELFPFYGEENEDNESIEELPLYKELKWDFNNNCPALENGQFVVLSGNEALKVWCYKALLTTRYKYLIYSWDYGSEFEMLIGDTYSKTLIQSECIRYVEECLMTNPYIKNVSDITVDFNDSQLQISCTIETIYGVENIQEVNIGV